MTVRSPPEGPEVRLRTRLTGFLSFLRRGGYPVGTGAEIDLARAVDAIDVLSRPRFRSACAATLAKSPEELRFVSAAFDRYFAASGDSSDMPWAGAEVAALRPPSSAARPSGPRPAGRTDEAPPPVVVPIGTYSASAPSSAHPVEALPARDVRRIRHGVRRLRRETATLPGRRDAPSHRGTVDLRETVRRSLRHGGEWVELRRRRAMDTRAEFVVLWDVSGSMREHESRLFALVHALGSLSRRSRIFAFSTTIREITSDVKRYGYRRAATIVARRIERADGGTRIGESLHEFHERFGFLLSEATTLIVVSDGWDLGDAAPVAYELERLHRRVRRIVWVTPYTRRPGFRPEVGALRVALDRIDQLLGPEDFESPWPLRPYVR
jgi:uncharacterized protein